MQEALKLARQGIEQRHGGPFGAVVVYAGEIVGRGWNQVVLQQDPTAHAEILAIRDACHRLGRFHLEEASLYTSCEPCPMCLSAAYWARLQTIVYAADAGDAAAIGFDDSLIKQFLQQPLAARRYPGAPVAAAGGPGNSSSNGSRIRTRPAIDPLCRAAGQAPEGRRW